MIESERTLLFIYGTLKRGAANHAVLADQTFVGEAHTVPGYRLFVVADYPGLVKDPADRRGVTGELWSVTPPALARLDAFEGIPEKLYRRDQIALAHPAEWASADTYFYLRNIRGRRPIIEGIWPPP
jgi:gamma-glutamylaminecyclotransferase